MARRLWSQLLQRNELADESESTGGHASPRESTGVVEYLVEEEGTAPDAAAVCAEPQDTLPSLCGSARSARTADGRHTLA